MARLAYDSDISIEQFEVIKDDLKPPKRITRPRKDDSYDIFCAILYLLKNGCT